MDMHTVLYETMKRKKDTKLGVWGNNMRWEIFVIKVCKTSSFPTLNEKDIFTYS